MSKSVPICGCESGVCCTFFLVGFEEDLRSEFVFWFDADHFHEQSALPVSASQLLNNIGVQVGCQGRRCTVSGTSASNEYLVYILTSHRVRLWRGGSASRVLPLRLFFQRVRLQGQPEVHKGPLALLEQRGHGDGVVPPRSASAPYIRCFFLGSSATQCTKRKTESVVLLLSLLCPCELLPCVGVFLRSLQTLPNTGTVILSLEGPSGQTRACPTVRLAVGLTSTRATLEGSLTGVRTRRMLCR